MHRRFIYASERKNSRRALVLTLGAMLPFVLVGAAGGQSVSTFGGNAQHTAIYQPAAQNLSAVHWSTSINLNNSGAFAHYGAPLVSAANTVLVPVKTATNGFEISAFNGATGTAMYTLATDYILPSYNWIPVYQPALVGSGSAARLYYAGAGGTVYYISNPDSATPGTPVHQVFYTTLANYSASASNFNSTIFIDTPITADSDGDIFFGFRVQGTAPAPLNTTQSGFARIDANGNATYVLAASATGDSNIGRDSHNSAPALSNDQSTVYVVAKSPSTDYYGYLLGLDSTTLATKYKVFLKDPRNGNSGGIPDDSTASPTVAPDNDVYFGVYGNPDNGSRGFLLRFSGDLSVEKTPGAFGWDFTPGIVPASMVPSYSGPSAYLIFSKYNNYANDGDGNGVNRTALLDPNATQIDPHPSANGLVEMREVLTVIGITPDPENLSSTYPYAVREWCINTPAINPATNSIFTPSEDGHIYRWNLSTNSLSQVITLGSGVGEPYVPTIIGPDGTVYTLNGGTLFALGNLNAVGVAVGSSTPDMLSVVSGQSLTFTATVTNTTSSSATPTGTINFQDVTFQGLTPVSTTLVSNVPLAPDGTATMTTSTLAAGVHFITAVYSGDSNFSSGSAALVQRIHSSASITALSSGPNPSAAGESVTLTAAVTPAQSQSGTPSGMVTFENGNTVLAQTPLSSGTASFHTSNLSVGSNSISAIYNSDTLFASSSGSATQNVAIDTLNVSISSPANGATVSGTITVSANATGNFAPTGVQFQVDDSNFGQINGSGPSYSISWNTTTVGSGSHTLTAIASDTAGNTVSSSISVSVNNPGPALSGVLAGAITPSGATITWTTNEPATSQVAYGMTSAYGSTSPLNSTLVTSHSVTLSGLAAGTLYHYQALSQDAQGNPTNSADYTFRTLPAGLQTLLQIHADSSEVSGVANGSTVTPGTAPAGFTGTVVVHGTGAVNFGPAEVGNGVYFLNCCTNTNNAYYQFTGPSVGNIFNASQGQISFYLESRYSFAQRQSNATSARSAFDVRDGNGAHLFYFLTEITSGRLVFTYATGGTGQYYYVPQGTENTLFGSGVILEVTLTWTGNVVNLYLNNTLVKSSSYTPSTPSWTAASNFDLGAYQYLNFGGYNVSDDVLDEFSVAGPVTSTTPPPTVSITAPANGVTVSGTVTISANATSSIGIQAVQFQIDGVNLGNQVTGAGPTYSVTWNTTNASNTSHTLTAIATDTQGNTGTSSISVTVSNTSGPVISGVSASSITSSSATINWTTNEPATSQVAYGTTSAYSSTTPLNSTLVTAHSVTLSGLAAGTLYHYQVLSQDSQANQAASGDFTFTTAAAGMQTLLQIQGNASEVSGIANGSTVTPASAPAGFTGTVVVQGTGSVSFAPAEVGNGVYFLNCCSNTNNAYYRFTGSTIGNIFNASQGQISFYLESRYSFAQRQSSAASARFAFDVRDGNGNHLFYFQTQVTSGRLVFTYAAGGTGQYYYVPQGTENTLFGSGVILEVTLTWTGNVLNLYLNNTLVKSSSYTVTAPSWTAASNFDLGAYQYLNFGGYDVCDDVLNEFTVTGPTPQ